VLTALLFGGLATRPAAAAPHPPSPVIRKVTFDLDHVRRAAPGSDLWPLTWADDDLQYTSWGDGGGFGGTDTDGRVLVGIARVQGTAADWKGLNILGGKNPLVATAPFPGKSNGILCVKGVLYLHVIEQGKWWRAKIGRSTDHGRTWTFNEGAFDPKAWDFAEEDGAFSDLTFLTFGKDYRGARDGNVYVYSQDKRRGGGAIRDVTDGVAMFRVAAEKIMDRRAYEYFAGLDARARPRWAQDIRKRQPVFADRHAVGFAVRVAYNAGLRRYLLTTFRKWDGSWGIFDAPEPWGPWTTVATFDRWIDATPKFGFTFPARWISADGKTMYMVFSGTHVYDSFNVVKVTLGVK
jgi:hypothetical protein